MTRTVVLELTLDEALELVKPLRVSAAGFGEQDTELVDSALRKLERAIAEACK